MNEEIQDYIRKWTEEKESLTAKYLARTGYSIDEICLVERQTDTGRIFYPDLKSKHPIESMKFIED